jgi:hypothetical protein
MSKQLNIINEESSLTTFIAEEAPATLGTNQLYKLTMANSSTITVNLDVS